MEPSQYRFYPESLPSQGDFVMVQVTSVTSMGIYVVLLEYGRAEGMIVASEMSKKRIRSVHKLFKLGQILCCLVIRVDGVKGYIDLSKIRVTQEDTTRCVARYSRAKCVHSIIIRTAELLDLTREQQIYELYSKTSWHLNGVKGRMKKKVAAYDIFFQSLRDPEALNSCPIDDQARTVLLTTIQTCLHENKVHIKACISVRCYRADGVEAIKEALKEGLKFATEDVPIKILYLQAPLYTVTAEVSELQSRSSTDALQRIDEAISAVGQKIQSFDGGIFAIESKPKVVNKRRHKASAGNGEDDNFPSDSDNDKSDDPDDGDYFSDSHNGLDDSDTHNGSENDDTDLDYVSEKLIGACGLGDEDSGLGKDI